MYPYTKRLTLVEALRLFHSEIQFTVISSTSKHCADFDENTLKEYYNDGNYISCTALDYATHILGQDTPPEGWGYAAYELSSGRYDELAYWWLYYKWEKSDYDCYKKSDIFPKTEWNRYAFRLEDLAKVEGEPETEIPNTTDWKASYNKANTKYEILFSYYNQLPQEFKDLAISEMEISEEFNVKIYFHEAHNIKDRITKGELSDLMFKKDNDENVRLLKDWNINQLLGDGTEANYILTTASEFAKTRINQRPNTPNEIKTPIIDWEAKYQAQEAEIDYLKLQVLNMSADLRRSNAKLEIAEKYITAFQEVQQFKKYVAQKQRVMDEYCSEYSFFDPDRY
ncbi:MAG: hypothetical protein EBU90_01775 [Proteobacteria bacterium]|nr:hypothetical protein [Pseudomonadota bacterium]